MLLIMINNVIKFVFIINNFLFYNNNNIIKCWVKHILKIDMLVYKTISIENKIYLKYLQIIFLIKYLKYCDILLYY